MSSDSSLLSQDWSGAHGHGALEPEQEHRPPWCNDMSREIEVMRHVILRENQRLKEHVQVLQKECADLRDQMDAAREDGCGGTTDETTPEEGLITNAADGVHRAWEDPPRARAPPRRRVVEWLVRGVDGPRAARLGHHDRSTFELPEFPDVSFSYVFGAPRKPEAPEGTPPTNGTSPCQLTLSASGQGCLGLSWRVGLEVVQRISDGAGGSESQTLARHGNPACLGHASVQMSDHEVAVCPCRWPGSQANIVCRAQLELTKSGKVDAHVTTLTSPPDRKSVV